MRPLDTLRPALAGLGAAASLARGCLVIAGGEAEAQDVSPPSTGAPPDLVAEITVVAKGGSSTNALQAGTGVSRLPAALQDTPQTVTNISRLVIEQQQATTVEQVLQYVPGITVSTGEGNGGISGDQFRIRGFDASGDIYVDGLRDFGSYVRDSFDTEKVSVLKGPTSESFGAGTTGGAIELDRKIAHLGDAASVEVSAGSGPYVRTVLDVDRRLGDTSAVRVVAMGNAQDMVARDHVYADRRGVLASAGLGLGTDQTLVGDYFHQHSRQRPDFGVPILQPAQGMGEPVTEYGVARTTYFGRESDSDLMDADVATLRYTGRFDGGLTLTNDARLGYYTRDLKMTPAMCPFDAAAFTPPSSCASDVPAGDLDTAYTIWPVGGARQTSFGGEDVVTVVLRVRALGLRHELVAGVDGYAEHATTGTYVVSGPEPSGTLLQPVFRNSPGFSDVIAPAERIAATSWDIGPFLSDRTWLTSQLSILGGVRWDRYHVEGVSEGAPVDTTTRFASPKAALIWEPTAEQTYYASYARSFTPPGQNITSLSSSLGLSQEPAAANLKPEGDTTYELGGKWGLLEQRLGATAALFRVEKNNTSYTDPTSGAKTTTDDQDCVQGVELGLTGKIIAAWDVQAAYTYLDGRIVSSSLSPFTPVSAAGNRVPYVSRNGASVWTTYDLSALVGGPGHLIAGGGVNYRSDYDVDDANRLRIPAAVTADAMLSYDLDRYHLAFNVTNLTDALAYSSAFSNGYATPIAGRSFTFTLGVKF